MTESITAAQWRRLKDLPPPAALLKELDRRMVAEHKAKPKGMPRLAAPKMNKTESRFFDILQVRVLHGEFQWVKNHAMTLLLADGLRFTPDMFGQHKDGSLWCWEVKGAFVRDDALAKFKMARTCYPCFTWVWAQYTKENGWVEK